jgi:hypothetical protein
MFDATEAEKPDQGNASGPLVKAPWVIDYVVL